MRDARELYEFVQSEANHEAGAPMLHLMDGFLDAGRVLHGAVEHLLRTCHPERVVTFDVDAVHDYRSRRPVMTFDMHRWDAVTMPEIVVDRLTDADGAPFYLLHGQEPDSEWQRMVAATLQVADALTVSRLYTLSGIPLAVPHTRPTGITRHATQDDLVHDNAALFGRVEVPGQWSALLQLRAGEAGREAMGYVTHVPHYLSQVYFPQAVKAALEALMSDSGLRIPLTGLDAEISESMDLVNAEIAGSQETTELVAALEQAFDTAQEQATVVPSADEIAAEFERFLAEREQDQNP